MTLETYNKIREEIKRIQNPIRTCVVDEEEIVSHEDTAGDARGDDNQRSSDSTGQLTIETAANAHVDETSVADAQINTEGDGEMTATEIEAKEQELQSTITRLQRELAEKDELITERRTD